ncbi:hypothetical protein D3C81_384450 [compost metagenome]
MEQTKEQKLEELYESLKNTRFLLGEWRVGHLHTELMAKEKQLEKEISDLELED